MHRNWEQSHPMVKIWHWLYQMPFTGIMENGKQASTLLTMARILLSSGGSAWAFGMCCMSQKFDFFWNWKHLYFMPYRFPSTNRRHWLCSLSYTKSWIVEDITRMHEKPHSLLWVFIQLRICRLSPVKRLSISNLQGDLSGLSQVGVHCCQTADHQANNFSTDCSSCHSVTGTAWKGDPILHSFFPLEQGHKGIDCFGCHKPPAYTGLDANCISCHADAINAAQSVDHSLFPTDCKLCHTLAIGWKPAGFSSHDAYFPIYSGKHKGRWNECVDCHIQSSNYKIFSCINCHEHNNAQKMAKEHDEVSGFKFKVWHVFWLPPKRWLKLSLLLLQDEDIMLCLTLIRTLL